MTSANDSCPRDTGSPSFCLNINDCMWNPKAKCEVQSSDTNLPPGRFIVPCIFDQNNTGCDPVRNVCQMVSNQPIQSAFSAASIKLRKTQF